MNATHKSILFASQKLRWWRVAWILIVILVCVAVGYLAITAYTGFSVSTPDRNFAPDKASVFAVTPQDVKIPTADGLEIAGWFIPSTASDKALLLVHGHNSSRSHEFGGEFPELAAAMHRRGFSVLMIDLRGHGQSEAAYCTFGLSERQDVIGAVNWLKQQGFQPSKIGVLGVSLGAAAVIGAAADNPDIGVLVLDNSFAEIYPLIEERWRSASGLPNFFLPTTLLFNHWLTGYDQTSSRPFKELERISSRPIFIIHSRLDPSTPVEHAYKLRATAPNSEYWETATPKHSRNYNSDPQEYVDKVADFLGRNLK